MTHVSLVRRIQREHATGGSGRQLRKARAERAAATIEQALDTGWVAHRHAGWRSTAADARAQVVRGEQHARQAKQHEFAVHVVGKAHQQAKPRHAVDEAAEHRGGSDAQLLAGWIRVTPGLEIQAPRVGVIVARQDAAGDGNVWVLRRAIGTDVADRQPIRADRADDGEVADLKGWLHRSARNDE
jgi:hypothetical protein